MKYGLGARLGPVLGAFGQVILFDVSWWLFSIPSQRSGWVKQPAFLKPEQYR